MKANEYKVIRDDWDSVMLDHGIPLDLHPWQQARELYKLPELSPYDDYPEFKEAASLAIWSVTSGKYAYHSGEYIEFSKDALSEEIVPRAEFLHEKREAWQIFAPGVNASPYSRKFLAGMALAEHGLRVGVNDDLIRQVDIASRVPVPEETRRILRDAWHVINGYEYYLRTKKPSTMPVASNEDSNSDGT
jgi:hypothetical protein